MNELAQTTLPAPEQAPAPAAGQGAPAPQVPSPFADLLGDSPLKAVTLRPIEHDKPTDPAQDFVVQNFQNLAKLGLDYHEFDGSHDSVVFNPAKVTPAELEKAHKAGKLAQLAPVVTDLAPIAELSQTETPAPAAAGPLADATAAPQAAPMAQPQGSVPANRALQAARVKNTAQPPKFTPNPVVSQLSRRAT